MKIRMLHMTILILFLAGCEKAVDWNLDKQDLNRLVVDAIITNELKSQLVRLSVSNREMNQSVNSLSGASVTVDDGTQYWVFTESADGVGWYYSSPFQAVIDHRYHLQVIHETDTFEAWSGTEPVTPLDTLVYTYDETNDLFQYVYTGSGQPAMTKIFYNWSADTAYCTAYGNCQAQETFYTLDNVDVNALFSPEREQIYFPSGTVILRQKYSLTEEHRQFLRSLLMETDWSGGMFDVQHGNTATNITHEGLGFFAVCMVATDTSIVW